MAVDIIEITSDSEADTRRVPPRAQRQAFLSPRASRITKSSQAIPLTSCDSGNVQQQNEGESTSVSGWSDAQNKLLMSLFDAGFDWPHIMQSFPGRKEATVKFRHWALKSGKASMTSRGSQRSKAQHPQKSEPPLIPSMNSTATQIKATAIDQEAQVRSRPKQRHRTENNTAGDCEGERLPESAKLPSNSSRVLGLLHVRELGSTPYAGLQGSEQALRDAMGTAYFPVKSFNGASGDVSTVAWSSDGKLFAAGAVAVSDPLSRDYNKRNNLMIGHVDQGCVQELPDHHIECPRTHAGATAHRTSHEIYESRLYTTVQMVGFSPNAPRMYSVSIDGRLNAYDTNGDSCRLMDTQQYNVSVDLLAVTTLFDHDYIASGRKTTDSNSITVHSMRDCDGDRLREETTLSWGSSRVPVYPSALKWGVTARQSHYLLAGFAQDRTVSLEDEDAEDAHGEMSLFDLSHGAQISVQGSKSAVFDVAWNPNPTGQSVFAVASYAGNGLRSSGVHSVVRLFSAAMRHHLELECPARDLNDVVYCPYDDNIIAAGSTDGKVYIWDIRFAKASQMPRHRFAHGSCLSVLPHDRERWEADTGIRFLSWGQSANRLYSASSDGIVKAWNPYLGSEDGHVEDVAKFQSNIMSGAFSPDYSSLLIGEDHGKITLLSLNGKSDTDDGPVESFKLKRAPEPVDESDEEPHHDLFRSGALMYAPAGALPFKQVVQGPNFRRDAVVCQVSNGHTKGDCQSQDILEIDFAALQSHQAKTTQQTRAAAFQRDLKRKRNEWKSRRIRGVKPCNRDRGCTTRSVTEAGQYEVDDSGRSHDRIPDSRRRPIPGFAERIKLGLLAICSQCDSPARADGQDHRSAATAASAAAGAEICPILCESCAFACFRCGAASQLSSGQKVRCGSCRITWRADCIGYEMLERPDKVCSVPARSRTLVALKDPLDDDMFWRALEVDDVDDALDAVVAEA